MVGGAGESGGYGGVDGEGGGAFCGAACPGAALRGFLPGVALFLGEGELLLEIVLLSGGDCGLFLRGGQLDLALLAGLHEGFGLWGIGERNFGNGSGIGICSGGRRSGDADRLRQVHDIADERSQLFGGLCLRVLFLQGG